MGGGVADYLCPVTVADEQEWLLVNVSVSFNPKHISWHTAGKMPEYAALRYLQALKLLGKCKDIHDATDVLEQLNDTQIGGHTFAPAEDLQGLLQELADNFRHG